MRVEWVMYVCFVTKWRHWCDTGAGAALVRHWCGTGAALVRIEYGTAAGRRNAGGTPADWRRGVLWALGGGAVKRPVSWSPPHTPQALELYLGAVVDLN